MIVLRGAPGPLDKKITIPMFGIVISIRSVLRMICTGARLDKTLCDLVTSRPGDACTKLVGMGDKWLHDKIDDALDTLVNQVLKGVDCQKKNWKEIVGGAIDVSFSNNGISVEIDTTELMQNVICAVARKAIDVSLEPAINLVVRELKAACSKLHATPAGSDSSIVTTAQPMTMVKAAAQIQPTKSKILAPRALIVSKPTTHPLVAGGTSLAVVGGFTWLLLRRW